MFLCAHKQIYGSVSVRPEEEVKAPGAEVQATVNLPTWVLRNVLKFWKSGKRS